MLSGLRFRFSPARRRFMRELAGPGLSRFNERLLQVGSGRAVGFISTLNGANADFMAFALSPSGPLAGKRAGATPKSLEACLGDLLVYAVNLFARDELFRDDSDLIPLLAQILGTDPKRVMLKRDQLRKAPRSEEWMLYTWLIADLGGESPPYDARLERSFGYQYLSYIDQYRAIFERELNQPGGD
jgi:hypothetical protein